MQAFTSVPFKASKYQGLAEVNGFAKFSPAGIVLEFESKLLGLVSVGVKEARIAMADILDIKFKKGVFKLGAKIEIRTTSLAAMAGLPNEQGILVLKVKTDDFERARNAVERMQGDIAEYAANLPPPSPPPRSLFDNSEDDTQDLDNKEET